MNGKPWDLNLNALLGRAYDHEIATASGHCVKTVTRRRVDLGIEAYRGLAMVYRNAGGLPATTLEAIAEACRKC